MKKGTFPVVMLNLVRIWGCGWLAMLISLLPMYIIRGTTHNYTYELISDAIVYILVTFIFIAYFNVKEGRKLKSFNIGYILKVALVPVFIHLFIVVITKGWVLFSTLAGSTYLLIQTGSGIALDFEDLPAVTFKSVLKMQPIYELFHIAAIFSGYYIGYRMQLKLRKSLEAKRVKA
jgi:hypothetical protein